MFAEIKGGLRIEEVVGRYVPLRGQGRVLVGRCPFHDDGGRPNLTVFPDTQTFCCFACGARGDVIDFVAAAEHTSAVDAARRLEGTRAAVPGALQCTRPEPILRQGAEILRRDAVYQRLLRMLPLSPEHYIALLARGLPIDMIEVLEYATLPERGRLSLAQRLLKEGHDLRRVPGFARSKPGGWWQLFGASGILIPVRDEAGCILALQVRSNKSGGPRYRWLSTPDSDRRFGGASSGAPCHVAGREHLGTAHQVWITEGPLKADVAAHFLQAPVLGVAGVANWRRAVPVIKRLRSATAVLAFDRDVDAATREAVGRNQAELGAALGRLGFRVLRATWTHGKGLDDALAAGELVRGGDG